MTASSSVNSNFLSGQDTPQRESDLTISSYYAKNPVLFMTFNRPAETTQVFSQIRKDFMFHQMALGIIQRLTKKM